MRRKKRIRIYFGILVIFTVLGSYYKYQRILEQPVLNETWSTWSVTQVTDSVIHHSTGLEIYNSNKQAVTAMNYDDKDTMTHEQNDTQNSMSLLQYISNVSNHVLKINN